MLIAETERFVLCFRVNNLLHVYMCGPLFVRPRALFHSASLSATHNSLDGFTSRHTTPAMLLDLDEGVGILIHVAWSRPVVP